MPDGVQEPPTYYANVVTSHLTVDELILELRRFLFPHREISEHPPQGVIITPPPSPEELMRLTPMARVVLTFSAAKALKDYLDAALPLIEAARKAGATKL